MPSADFFSFMYMIWGTFRKRHDNIVTILNASANNCITDVSIITNNHFYTAKQILKIIPTITIHNLGNYKIVFDMRQLKPMDWTGTKLMRVLNLWIYLPNLIHSCCITAEVGRGTPACDMSSQLCRQFSNYHSNSRPISNYFVAPQLTYIIVHIIYSTSVNLV